MSSESPSPAYLTSFVRSIALLALPYNGQVAWLTSLVLGTPTFADELALELDDGVLLSRQFKDAGWISPEAHRAAVVLNDLLRGFGRDAHEDFWHLDSLRNSPDWERVRALALETLIAL